MPAGRPAVRRAGACLLPHLSSRGSEATRDLVGAANASCARRAGRTVGWGFHAPPISTINHGPPFHPNCVHALTPFVQRLATEEERKRGIIEAEVVSRTPAELQQRFHEEYTDSARVGGRVGR